MVFSRFSYHLQNFSFPFSDSIDSTYTQAAATRGTFLLALARELFFRMLQGLSECCTCSQSQVLQQSRCDNVAEYSLNLQDVVDIGDTWLRVQPPSTSVAEQLRVCPDASASRKSQA